MSQKLYHEWLKSTNITNVLIFLVPGEVKLFGNDRLDEALAWIVQ